MAIVIDSNGRRVRVPDNMSRADFDAWEKRQMSMAEPATPVSEVTVYAPRRAPAGPQPKPGYGWDDLGRDLNGAKTKFLRGTVIGDEAEAGLGAILDGAVDVVGGRKSPLDAIFGVGDHFKARRAEQKASEEDFEARHPVLATGAEALGGAATFLVPGGMFVKGGALLGQGARLAAPVVTRLAPAAERTLAEQAAQVGARVRPYAEGAVKSAISSAAAAAGGEGDFDKRFEDVVETLTDPASWLLGSFGDDAAKVRAHPKERLPEPPAKLKKDKREKLDALDQALAQSDEVAERTNANRSQGRREAVKKWGDEQKLNPAERAQVEKMLNDPLQQTLASVGGVVPNLNKRSIPQYATFGAPVVADALLASHQTPASYIPLGVGAMGALGVPAQFFAGKLTDRGVDDLRRTIGSTKAQRESLMERNMRRNWVDPNDPAVRDMGRRLSRTGGVIVGNQHGGGDEDGAFRALFP